MTKLRSKAGLSIVKSYLLLVLAALVFTLIALKKTAFAGLYLLLLTLPWSILSTKLMDGLHIQDSVPIVIKIGISILESFLNAGILYVIGAIIEKTKMEGNDKWTQL